MLEISELAQEKLREHLKSSQSDMAVRVTVTAG
jgi:Fe-S cluster assembly iron-binding protein IscA